MNTTETGVTASTWRYGIETITTYESMYEAVAEFVGCIETGNGHVEWIDDGKGRRYTSDEVMDLVWPEGTE